MTRVMSSLTAILAMSRVSSTMPISMIPTMRTPVTSWVRAPWSIAGLTPFSAERIWTRKPPTTLARPMKCRTTIRL